MTTREPAFGNRWLLSSGSPPDHHNMYCTALSPTYPGIAAESAPGLRFQVRLVCSHDSKLKLPVAIMGSAGKLTVYDSDIIAHWIGSQVSMFFPIAK